MVLLLILGLSSFLFGETVSLHPNDPRAYLSHENFDKIDEKYLKIDTNLSLTAFYYYPPGGATFQFNAHVNPMEIEQRGFDSQKPTKIFVHGWTAEAREYCEEFKNAYDVTKINAFCIDWDKLATADNYFIAAFNSFLVGRYAGQKLGGDLFLKHFQQTPDQIHIIGHSLGAHLAGNFGRKINELGYGKVARVTGLDPARPFFDDLAPEELKMTINDAELVDIIHTNSGDLFDGCLSYPTPLGHLDFYPNGGQHQPGCSEICLGFDCLTNDLFDLFNGACSHTRAHNYYAESAQNAQEIKRFISTECLSYGDFLEGNCGEDAFHLSMGESLETSSLEGIQMPASLYLKTREESPFTLTYNLV